ncbi:class I SAM-dependent methyltransferase [uncultured Spongiibacter sp.]|uniref:class I SAM-dependent methyltransferase n=1 Tax=uncultured Spongiibacter sp. TaxID=870896 RepID=UPI00258EDE4E|nr:class I SAM-dependent methyltransferase [uncultured Spongiibacter sp.]
MLGIVSCLLRDNPEMVLCLAWTVSDFLTDEYRRVAQWSGGTNTVGDSEKQIVESWQRNAGPWVAALDQQAIASRVAVTNGAIVNAVLSHHPQRVLDVGCGEGWLMRELAGHGVDVAGFDAVAELVAEAIARGSKNCQCIAYEALDEVAWPQTFDLAVCNFSLLGESVEQPLRSLKQTLSASGHLLVQTLHPCFITRGESYCSTWLKGSWEGLPDHLHRQFKDAPPWYFRTLSDWSFVFQKAGYSIAKIDEPSMDDGSLPLSILFQLRPV